MKNTSFKFKLLGLCIFLCAIGASIGILAFRGLNEVNDAYATIVDDVIPNDEQVNQMFLSYRSVRINLRSLGLPDLSKVQADEYIRNTHAAIESYEKAWKAYSEMHHLPGVEDLTAELDREWKSFKQIGVTALKLHASGTEEDRRKLLEIFSVDCPRAANSYTAAITNIREFYHKASERHVLEAKAHYSQARLMILSVLVVGIFSGLGIGYVFSNSLTRAVSVTVEKLTRGSEQVASASSQLNGSSQSLSQSSAEQAASLQETAASLEQISAMVKKAMESARTTASSSQNSQAKAEEGRAVVERMKESMGEIDAGNEAIRAQVEQSNQQMAEMVKVIQEIGTRTKVINDIVFQTKLLSFNASVEAARAGEQGKGFAVVADEVGKLAEMSGNASKEISSMLDASIKKVEGIVRETKSSVERQITASKGQVSQGIEIANQCARALDVIVENVSRVTDMSEEISQASEEQTRGVGEIAKAMAQLDQVTQQNSIPSEETAHAAGTLSTQAVDLKSAIAELVTTVHGRTAA